MREWGHFTTKLICTPFRSTKSMLATSYGSQFFLPPLSSVLALQNLFAKREKDFILHQLKRKIKSKSCASIYF